jgi:hypothetical protein
MHQLWLDVDAEMVTLDVEPDMLAAIHTACRVDAHTILVVHEGGSEPGTATLWRRKEVVRRNSCAPSDNPKPDRVYRWLAKLSIEAGGTIALHAASEAGYSPASVHGNVARFPFRQVAPATS